jgi:hypothetical protein
MSARTSTTPIPPQEAKEEEQPWSTPTPPNDEENALSSKEQHESGTKDPNIVDWEANDDENPRNWSTAYKSWITFQLGMLALAASLGTSLIAPAGNTIAEYVGVGSEVSVLAVSLYM